MKAFVLSNNWSHIPFHERRYGNEKIILTLMKAESKEELFEIIYGRNCSETYCYPRSDYRFLSKTLTSKFKQWKEQGGMQLYAKYNRMD